MGLDISAYKKATFVREKRTGEESDEEWPRLSYLYVNEDFVDVADGMTNGLYDVGPYNMNFNGGPRIDEHQFHFCAGSYSGYNDWRDWLTRTMHGMTAAQFWRLPIADERTRSFYELIDFADNEGIIGPKTSAKLARDFADNRERAERKAGSLGREWRLRVYDYFQQAFELAAGGGVVQFH